jgi:hypothetical protein
MVGRKKTNGFSVSEDTGGLLKNVTQLSEALGVSPCFVKRMKWAGFPMPGGRSTVQWALAWLKANPDFRQRDWTKPRPGGGHQPHSGVDR